jgi:hypothetical protein
MTVSTLTLADAGRILREALRDDRYKQLTDDQLAQSLAEALKEDG